MALTCSLSEVHGNEESRCRKDLLVRIGLRPRRSALGVVPELAEFLRAAAGFGDLRGPTVARLWRESQVGARRSASAVWGGVREGRTRTSLTCPFFRDGRAGRAEDPFA